MWTNICVHGFSFSQEGTKLFCQKMGYEGGSFSKRDSASSEDSFRLGKCNVGDIWESCRGGCNDYERGGLCSDYSEGQSCSVGGLGNIEIAITCTGWNGKARTSCGSINLKIFCNNFNSQKELAKTTFYRHLAHASSVLF